MPKKISGSLGRTLDARPDRVDLRDRVYSPPLRSLPREHPDPALVAKYLPTYQPLVRDQLGDGACTGFGLSAMINFVLWWEATEANGGVPPSKPVLVSPRMLYHLARIYDEWDGEDYEGSSCRGAMKAWHRHGACVEQMWPYGNGKFVRPVSGWQRDAAERTLGAYYRVDKDSVADMQAAIHEVGAVYVSADVHAGWALKRKRGAAPLTAPPEIVLPSPMASVGGHAFALVGYTPTGFIVQNSWGGSWGFHGFAVLTYMDWITNGRDAWVAAMGAPIDLARATSAVASHSLDASAADRAGLFGLLGASESKYEYNDPAVAPLPRELAYEQTVVFGNDGVPIRRIVDHENASAGIDWLAYERPRDWLTSKGSKKLVLYAHGGLNSEEASLKRVQLLAPYFLANAMYPLFITWKTGVLESFGDILGDAVHRLFPGEGPEGNIFESLGRAAAEAKDRTIELAARGVAKPVWAEMKENAERAADAGSGLTLVVNAIAKLAGEISGLEIHLVGHSAGSILFGHLFRLLGKRGLAAETLTLFAPACSLEFALDYYAPARASGALKKTDIHFDVMSDDRERADSVGPYGKSLLYLVSRALEREHKTPILGLAEAWNLASINKDLWSDDGVRAVKAWAQVANSFGAPTELGKSKQNVTDRRKPKHTIKLAHGSFDNDVEVITATLERILGAEPVHLVENLLGF
jgi:hypothetical protein